MTRLAILAATLLSLTTTARADDDLWNQPDADGEAPAPIVEEAAPSELPIEPSAPIAEPVPPARGPFANVPLTTVRSSTERPAFTRAFSLQLMTLDNSGLSIQAERASKKRKKVSYALAVGGRSSAQGEYASKTLGVGLEARRWLRRPEGMTGWYVGLRTDLSRTRVEDVMEDRDIGSLTTWTVGVSTGYRWVLWRRVEITPSIGAAMVVEGGMNGMSPTTVRGAGILGLTAGAIF